MKKYNKASIDYGYNAISSDKIQSLLNQKKYIFKANEDDRERDTNSEELEDDEDYNNEDDQIEQWNYNDKYDPDLFWRWTE